MAFLIPVDGEVTLISRESRYCDHLGGYFEMLPFHLHYDKIEGSNGKIYQYVILIDEDAIQKRLLLNKRAVQCAILHYTDKLHQKNIILGPVIIEPYDEDEKYTMDDWKAIREGTCENIELIAKNIQNAKFATERYDEY